MYIQLRTNVNISPFQNLQSVDYFTKVRRIIQNACYYLFSTDQNKIFHIKYVYISPSPQFFFWIYKSDPIQKFTSPWLLILCCNLNDPNSCIWIPQLSWSVWKDGSQNHTVIVGKGSNTQKCWKTKEFMGIYFFWRTAGSLTVQDKQGTHEQPSLQKKTQLWIIQVITQF